MAIVVVMDFVVVGVGFLKERYHLVIALGSMAEASTQLAGSVSHTRLACFKVDVDGVAA